MRIALIATVLFSLNTLSAADNCELKVEAIEKKTEQLLVTCPRFSHDTAFVARFEESRDADRASLPADVKTGAEYCAQWLDSVRSAQAKCVSLTQDIMVELSDLRCASKNQEIEKLMAKIEGAQRILARAERITRQPEGSGQSVCDRVRELSSISVR